MQMLLGNNIFLLWPYIHKSHVYICAYIHVSQHLQVHVSLWLNTCDLTSLYKSFFQHFLKLTLTVEVQLRMKSSAICLGHTLKFLLVHCAIHAVSLYTAMELKTRHHATSRGEVCEEKACFLHE